MKFTPPESAPEIEAIALNILKDSKAYGVFPTPIDKITSHVELCLSKDIDLGEKKQPFFSRQFENIGRVSSKVLGLLDFRTKTIYLDLNQPVNRMRFVQLHEVGHKACPWQEPVYRWDDEETIDPFVKELFEKEASFFASAALFQLNRFDDDAIKLPLSVKSPMSLASKFGASIHASLRRYVEYSKKRCALLVFKKPNFLPDISVGLRNYFASRSFVKEFGELNWPESFNSDYPFIEDILRKRRLHENGEFITDIGGHLITFDYHYFNNAHNVFVLLKPKGEKNRSRTRIILSGDN